LKVPEGHSKFKWPFDFPTLETEDHHNSPSQSALVTIWAYRFVWSTTNTGLYLLEGNPASGKLNQTVDVEAFNFVSHSANGPYSCTSFQFYNLQMAVPTFGWHLDDLWPCLDQSWFTKPPIVQPFTCF
jgi:hypothetical protein